MSQLRLSQDSLYSLFSHAMDTTDTRNLYGLVACLMQQLGLDVTRFGINASSTRKVLSALARLAPTGLVVAPPPVVEESDVVGVVGLGVVGSEAEAPYAVRLSAALSAASASPSVPRDMMDALMNAGVDPSVVSGMYFEEGARGQAFRVRMRDKWRTFVRLAEEGKLRNPSGYFRRMIERNWYVSADYDPDFRKKEVARKAERARVEAERVASGEGVLTAEAQDVLARRREAEARRAAAAKVDPWVVLRRVNPALAESLERKARGAGA